MKSLKNLVNDFILNKDIKVRINITKDDPINYLTPNRLDIGFKLFFINLISEENTFPLKIYKEHIRAITNGTFKEFGNEDKDSLRKYIDDFKNTDKSIKNEFDSSKSIIPLGKRNTIVDGSHRVTSAIINSKKITIQKFNIEDPNYNWEFFKKRGVNSNYIDIAVNEFLKYSEKYFAAFVWPVASENINMIIKTLGTENILYVKKLKLSANGGHNLLTQLYKGQEWLGGLEESYNGAISKLSKTFNSKGIIHVIFFRQKTIQKVIDNKKKIRNKIGIGKHSIHINDNKEELKLINEIVLNNNSIKFIDKGKTFKYKKTIDLVQKFKSKVDRLNFDIENFVICGSTPLAIFGYCNSNDIDYLSTYDINEISDDISSHKMYAHFYKKPINELIFNPENYFYFNGIKFLTTNNIIEFKKNRGEPKDLWIIQKMNNNNKFKLIFTSIINYISLFKYKLVGQIIYLSKPLGLYNFLKEIYKFFNKPSE